MSLFVEGSYDVLEFSMPPNGMNQNISPRVLPPNFAYVLDNILPIPQGRGMVRYGTSLINNDLAPDSNILETFSFIKPTGGKQLVLYVQDFTEDLSIEHAAVTSTNIFTFDSFTPSQFVVNAPIKITYSGSAGIITLYSTIADVIIDETLVTIFLAEDNIFPENIEDITITHIYYADGNLYQYDFDSETLSASLMDGLSVTTVPRSVTFQNTLIICNGIDPIMSWDGTTFEVIIDFVKELANSFNLLTTTSFSFVIPANFIIEKYQNNAPIQVSINGEITATTVTNISVADNIATITTADGIPDFTGQDTVILLYGDMPPTFNFLFVAHDRLWALGPGEVGINYRDPDQALLVYYANQPNSYTSWFDERTKVVLNEDLSDKHGIPDNLEAICLVNNLVAFIGRNKAQIWQGFDPTPNASPANEFRWAYNLPIGIAHGNLLIDLPNEVYFITENGLVSFSTFNIAKQLVASPYDAIDPIIRKYISTITNSDLNYRACRSFKYKGGPFCGFKIGNNKLLVSLYSTNLYAWSFFSGDFSNAQCFCSSLDNSLYLGIGNKIYQYGDGKDSSEVVYGDQDGNAPIRYYWTLPAVHQSGKRFANKRYEIQVDYPSSFFINEQNSLSIGIMGDVRQTFSLEDQYELSERGDPLNTIPLAPNLGDPNKPSNKALGMRLDVPHESTKGRLKFIASSFWLSISGYCINGPVYFDRIRLFGIFERNS